MKIKESTGSHYDQQGFHKILTTECIPSREYILMLTQVLEKRL